jgi:hypothetical protein
LKPSRNTQALITQNTQFNRHHCPEQQQCGWLLLNTDRFTEGLLNLQHAGLIRYARGNSHRKTWQVLGSVRYHTDHTSSRYLNADMATSATSYI